MLTVASCKSHGLELEQRSLAVIIKVSTNNLETNMQVYNVMDKLWYWMTKKWMCSYLREGRPNVIDCMQVFFHPFSKATITRSFLATGHYFAEYIIFRRTHDLFRERKILVRKTLRKWSRPSVLGSPMASRLSTNRSPSLKGIEQATLRDCGKHFFSFNGM